MTDVDQIAAAVVERLKAEIGAIADKPWGELTAQEKVEYTQQKYGPSDDFDPQAATDDDNLKYIENNGLEAWKAALRRSRESS